MSCSSGEDKSGSSNPKKTKKHHHKQEFRDEWLSESNFKTWLQCDPKDQYHAICKLCDVKMLADRGTLKRHAEGKEHLKKTKPITWEKPIATVFENQKFISNEDKRKTAEIKLAGFMAEHKMSHRVMDDLIDLLPHILPDSDMAKSFKMRRTKHQAVINNVLGNSEKQDLCEDLKKQKFSIMIDESTDIGSIKTMCVVVRYFCQAQGQIVSRFWDLIQIYGKGKRSAAATAKHLFDAVLKSFEENSIPIENIIGFGSDGCNTIMGCQNSVSTRFRAKFHGITVLKCVCHSLHYCASDACKKLPADCEKLTRGIYNYFVTSSKRQSQFKEFQVFAEFDIHKILRPAQTRWLSLSSVVGTILEKWSALKSFFNIRRLEDNECADIYKHLNEPTIKDYFFFLNWVLPKFTQANTLFQSETTMMTKISTQMNDLYYELVSAYMTKKHIAEMIDLYKIDPTDDKYFKNLDEIYLGLGVQKQLSTNEIPSEKKNEIKKNCRKFLINACVGFRKRYALNNDQVLVEISKLDPDSYLDASIRRVDSLQKLMTLLPRFAPTTLDERQKLDDQWRLLPKLKGDFGTSQRIDVFWHKVKQIEEFSLVAQFMLNILALPNSDAECERIFSQINNTKTKKRNKRITKTIRGNMLAMQAISRQRANCVSFQPTGVMLKLFHSGIYVKDRAIGLNDSDSD